MALVSAIFAPCSPGEAALSVEDRAQLQTPHGGSFYICRKNVNVNNQEKKEQARQLVITGKDYQMAMALLNFVIENDKDDSEAYILRAFLYADNRKYYEADNDFKSALMLEPDNPTFYYLRGMNAFYQKAEEGYSTTGAWKMFEKALELEPHYLDAMVGMGDYQYSIQGNPKGAIDWYNKILVVLPNHDVVLAKKEDAQKALQKIEEEDRRRELARQVG